MSARLLYAQKFTKDHLNDNVTWCNWFLRRDWISPAHLTTHAMNQHLHKVGNQPVIKQLNTISQYNQMYPIFFLFFPYRHCLPRALFRATHTFDAIHSTKIPTAPTGKSGPPQKMDQFFRNFSGWTEPIHWVSDRNFRKFWLNGSLALPPCFICLSRSVGGGGWGQRYKLMSIYPKESQRIPLFCFVSLVCFFVFFGFFCQNRTSTLALAF